MLWPASSPRSNARHGEPNIGVKVPPNLNQRSVANRGGQYCGNDSLLAPKLAVEVVWKGEIAKRAKLFAESRELASYSVRRKSPTLYQ